MEKLVTRAYNRFEVDETRGVIRKLSATPRLRDEIQYYVKLVNSQIAKQHSSQSYSNGQMITKTIGWIWKCMTIQTLASFY